MLEQTSGAYFRGINKKNIKKGSNLEIMFCGFPREKKHTWASSRKDGSVHLGYNITYPIILLLLFCYQF
jgi:hypothetical protein